MDLIRAQAKAGSFETGAFKTLPVPSDELLGQEADWRIIFSLVDSLAAHDETSLLFVGPAPPGWSAVSAMRRALDLVSAHLTRAGLILDPEVVNLELRSGPTQTK